MSSKSGWATSEFWLSLLSVIVPGVVSTFAASGNGKLIAAGVAVSGAYTLGRSAVKVAQDVRAAAEARRPAFDVNSFGGLTETEKARIEANRLGPR